MHITVLEELELWRVHRVTRITRVTLQIRLASTWAGQTHISPGHGTERTVIAHSQQ